MDTRDKAVEVSQGFIVRLYQSQEFMADLVRARWALV